MNVEELLLINVNEFIILAFKNEKYGSMVTNATLHHKKGKRPGKGSRVGRGH